MGKNTVYHKFSRNIFNLYFRALKILGPDTLFKLRDSKNVDEVLDV